MSEIKLVWKEVSLEVSTAVSCEHIVQVVKHGDSMFFYLDVDRTEAERRFAGEIESRSPVQALVEPDFAEGYTIDFDDQFFLWINPGDSIQRMVDLLIN